MATSRLVPPSITVADAGEAVKQDDPHELRRRFIGPMPEKVVSQLEGPKANHSFGVWKRNRQREDDDASLRDAIRRHALQFFVGHGGKEEDFGEDEERHIREQMYAKWKQSEWGQARTRRREARSGGGKKWIGTSFDVGVFLGVDIINKPSSVRTSGFTTTTNASASRAAMTRASTAADTFFTARSRPSPPTDAFSENRASQHTDSSRSSFLSPNGNNITRPISADSTTPLLSEAQSKQQPAPSIRKTRSELPHRPSAGPSVSFVSTRGEGKDVRYLTVPRDRKGKGKMVHYSAEASSRVRPETPEPAPPEEVLARSGSEVEDTSAGAAQQAAATTTPSKPPCQSDVIMRGTLRLDVTFGEVYLTLH